jgi:hypothetical protein
MKTSPPRTEQPPNWPMKWQIKALLKDFKYVRDLSFYLLARKGISEKPSVRLYEEGEVSPDYDKPLCFFCSYDEESIVRKNVYHYLDQLKLAGFNIIFISSSEAVSDADLKKLSKCCVRIINRENKGYDFYGWKTGLEKYAQYKVHAGLLLVNDSVLGPLFSIRDILARLENCDADIVGMTDSFHVCPHLQSYFLYCKKNVVLSEEFSGFFKEVEVLELKIAVIRRYEMGFSRLLRHRFRLSALYGLEPVLARIDYHQKPLKWVEPTFHLWKPLITEFQFPFLKKSLLVRKGVSMEEVSAVLAESGSPYNLDILNDWITPDRRNGMPAP